MPYPPDYIHTTTRLAGEVQPRGKHLLIDESTSIAPGGSAHSETVLYDLRDGVVQVSLVTRPDGTLFDDGTIATVRIVKGKSLSEATEFGYPRISIVRASSGVGFDLLIGTGVIPYAGDDFAETAFAEALSVANMLVWRLECREIDAMIEERDEQ